MFPLFKILLPNRQKYINFSNPVNGRLWLNLLEPHNQHGILFHGNLNLPKKRLGFSFCSNKLGLRGPMATDADNVVLGTSYAMGLSVDNGKNWYDLILNKNRWFNASMPVGPANHASVLAEYYTGKSRVLLYLYHPNIWKIAKGYANAASKGKTIFEYLRWRTDLRNAMFLYPRWLVKEILKILTGYSVYCSWNGRAFHFNAHYNWFDSMAEKKFIQSQILELNRIFSRFDTVIAIRTPIKEDSLNAKYLTARLTALRTNYEELWKIFCDNVIDNVRCYSLDHLLFTERHFHPFDTHWNAEGNLLFSREVGTIFRDNRILNERL